MMDPILDNLNKEQYEAVTHFEGPLLVMAGAGSGKTKVLTNRIGYLIRDKGISPFNILAITFTNKAAKEMKERVISLIGRMGKDMYISTFHAMCVHILRQDIYVLDYSDRFVIYDGQDQIALIKKVMADLNIDSKYYTPKRVLNTISNLKNDYVFPEEFKASLNNSMYKDDFKVAASRIYERYQKELKEANALDFDDLIMLTIKLFETDPAILAFYQEKFQFILVDEYQDTNTSQFRLVKMLSAKHNNIFVVGDTDQSIYSWRGANIRNIREFENDFQRGDTPVQTIFLEQNYRSYQTILDCANAVIKHNYNEGHHVKRLWSQKSDPKNKVTYYRAINSDSEADFIAQKIQSFLAEGYQPSDITVLYRTNASSLNLEKTFQRYRIDYMIYGNVGFFERKEIKDLIAYLRLVINPEDNVSFLRVINEPRRGIGKTSLDSIKDYAFGNQLSLFEAAIAIDTLTTRAKQSVLQFVELIRKLQRELPKMEVTDFIDLVLNESDYLPSLERDKDEDSEARIENLKEFKTLALDLEESITKDDVLSKKDLTSVDKLALVLNTLTLSSDSKREKDQAVKLMTVHAAKGLEFPIVFIYSVEENIFPLGGGDALEEDIEEERRLMYVAITRAKDQLFITNAQMRKIYGEYRVNLESRFIKEIPDSLLDKQGVIRKKRISDYPEERRTPQRQMGARPVSFEQRREEHRADQSQVKAGAKCTHSKFGEGVIVSISGDTATIAFAAPFGIKKLDVNHPAIKF